MATLTIVITQKTIQDYDGVNENIKEATGDIDGVALKEMLSCEDTETDTAVKTAYKDKLTNLGYSWDTEA